ncbi:MAG TPA: PilX N-terminal domain-containing pilus assembly protein [Burkholderiaceae bacterium]|nr:PilX N-terminal domain-containing pilus assembly protein [Burkholderiaceae bacterium]
MRHTRSTQRGTALVIGLILLAVITLLAVVGMNIANTELASSTSEQLRLRAFNAAETGIEARVQTLRNDATTSSTPDVRAAVAVENSPLNTSTGLAADNYGTTTTYRGEGAILSRYTLGTFIGFNYSIESTGTSARNAVAVHTIGAFIVNGVGDSATFGQKDPATAPVVALPATP